MIFKSNYILFIATIGLLVIGCKKEKLESSESGTPQFVSTFTFNNQEIEMTAGENSLVLQTATKNQNDTIDLESNLSPNDCEDCGPSLSVNLSSQTLASEWVNTNLKDQLENWNIAFEPASSTTSTVDVLVSSSGNAGPGFWSVDNVAMNTQPISQILLNLENEGTYDISFQSASGACGQEAVQSFTFDGESIPCTASLIPSGPGQQMYFAILSEGFTPNSTIYQWTYGDTTITNEISEFNIGFFPFAPQLCLEAVDITGCSNTVCANIAQTPIDCVTNFSIDSIAVESETIVELASLMSIHFRDASNNIFSSDLGSQSNSTVNLVAVDEYTEPESPERDLVKASFEIDCLLYDGSGSPFPFTGIIETSFEEPDF